MPHARGLRKNIAYNLQYLEYLNQTLNEFGLTSVLTTQTWKVFILVGTGITEAILYYVIWSKGFHKEQMWKSIAKKSTNEFQLNGRTHKVENTIWEKLDLPILEAMSFESMIQKAESKRLLGSNHEIYKKLQFLRKLRNRVHLQAIEEDSDTDYNRFNADEVRTMKITLYSILTSSLFSPIVPEKAIFDFLQS